MISFYTSLIAICWLALGVLCILVKENSWIPREDKRRFYLTYAVIALSALAEWLGIQLSGNTAVPAWVLSMVKCLDYTLTPMAGGAIVTQMKMHDRWSKALMILVAVNGGFQLLSVFTNWMIVIDDRNHYSHGPLYIVYVAVYFAVIVLTAAEFRAYGQTHRRQNRLSLYSVLLLVVIGILIQEVMGGEFRTAYVALTMGAAMMFIHYAEFYHMAANDNLISQRSQLMRDALSGVFSRHAYMKVIERYSKVKEPAKDTAVFAIDINRLKYVNDTLGHDAGDEMIVGAARCIEKVIGGLGHCYRTGGDEFVVFARMDKEQADNTLLRLDRETENWTGEKVKSLSVASGYAVAKDFPGLTIEKLVKKADQAMYADKADYYRVTGLDRRGLIGLIEREGSLP